MKKIQTKTGIEDYKKYNYLFDLNNKDYKIKNKTNNKFSVYKLVSLSIYLAWFLLSSTLLYFGYIPIGPTQITFLPLIIAIATIHLGWMGCLIGGIGFGFSSWIAAFIYGIIKYQNFDLAVIPRFLDALVIYIIYITTKCYKNPKSWKLALMGLFGVLFNTVFVLSAQYIHNAISPLKGILPVKEWIILHPINLIVEPIVVTILSILLFRLALYLRNKNNNYSRLSWN